MKEPAIHLPADLLLLISEIDEYKGVWTAQSALPAKLLLTLRRVATIESAGASTRIEGAVLSDAQVEELLSGLETTSFASRDEEEVVGYAEAMDLVLQSYADMKLTENHIRQLHRTMLRHSSKDERHRGSYKSLDNHVVAYDADGKEVGIIFKTSSPFDTPREMEELVSWTQKAFTERSHHPLIIIGVFIVDFLRIHPFQDGNGRLSRILTTLLLLRAGYSYVPYTSLERVIEENKDLYYKALRRTQTTLHSDDNADWIPWIGFFLRSLKSQKNALIGRIAQMPPQSRKQTPSTESPLPPIARKILDAFSNSHGLTISQLEQQTEIHRKTMRPHILRLIEQGLVAQHGQKKGVWYTYEGGQELD